MTRLTSDERRAIELELDALDREIHRLRSLLASQPEGSDGDTLRLLRPLCACGLPLDHRHPITGVPRSCADATERIAFEDSRGKPPVPGSVTRDVTRLVRDGVVDPAVADEFAAQVSRDLEDLR